MTTTQTHTELLAWQDRWSEPTLDELLADLTAQQRRSIKKLMAKIADLNPIHQDLVWYGPSWKWTIRFMLDAQPPEDDSQVLCYIVPSIEQPLACVPLADPVIETLPMRRLSKYIREGIRSAKRAVEISWASWSFQTDSEANLISDLVRRKHQALIADAN